VGEKEQLGRIPERQRAEDHRIHQAEDRRVGPDSQGERQDGHRGESQCLSHRSDGVADVLPKLVDEAQPPRLPAFFHHALHTAELETRAPRRFCRRDASAHEVAGVRIHVEAHLVVHAGFETATTKERREG
jgi:hypothetical protein